MLQQIKDIEPIKSLLRETQERKMKLAIEFETKVNEQNFALYVEGTIYRETYGEPLSGDLEKMQVFQGELEITAVLTPALREILEEVSMTNLYAQYEEDYGQACF